MYILLHKEVVAQRCPVKKVCLEILQNSQENTFAIFLKTPFYRPPPGDCFCNLPYLRGVFRNQSNI